MKGILSNIILFSIAFSIACCGFDLIDGDENTSCQSDGYLACADEVSANSQTRGTIDPEGDIDYYKINVYGAGVLSTKVDPTPSDLGICLGAYDETGAEISVNCPWCGDIVGTPRALPDLALGEGTYYLAVWGCDANSFSDEEYSLKLLWDTSDIFESNDTFASATSMSGTSVEATFRPENDNDYYKIDIKEDGLLVAHIIPPAEVNPCIHLYDSESQLLTESCDCWNTEPGQIQGLAANLAEGEYFILVHDCGYDASSKDAYLLEYMWTDDLCALDQSFAAACGMSSDHQALLYPAGDYDTYLVSNNGGGTVTLSPPAELRACLRIYNSMQEEVAQNCSSCGEYGESSYINVPEDIGEQFYIRALGCWDSASLEKYEVRIN